MSAKRRIGNVETGRGAAALLVVLYHTSLYYFGTPKYWADPAFGGVFGFGHAGVEFFFVLSGFIILTVHQKDIGSPERLVPFLKRRFERIYPFFWLVMAVTLAGYFLLPGAGEAQYRDPLNILQSAALVGIEPLNAVVFVSWTLWHEVLFYALFALMIALPRVGIPALIAWTGVCAGQFFGLNPPWPTYLTAFVNILFAFGIICAIALRKWSIPFPRLILTAGILLFFTAGAESVFIGALPPNASTVLYGIGGALFLLGAVESERRLLFAFPGWTVVLGQASYSIYLSHILTLTVFAKVAAKFSLPDVLPSWFAFPLLVAAATAAGIAIHYLVENPVIALVRGAISTMSLKNSSGFADKP